MRRCRRKTLCADCPGRAGCPAAVRRDKRARRPMADSASMDLLRRAAEVLESGWYTCEQLGAALYGPPRQQTRSGRMSIMVRARRPVNRLCKMGVLAARPGTRGVEYTLLPEGREVLG